MSLNIFENIDEVLGVEPSFGETFTSEDFNIIEKEYANIDSTIDKEIKTTVRYFSGVGYVGKSAGLLKEIHVYYDDEYLESVYDEPIQYENDEFYFKPEQDLRLMGFEQGSYNMVYNTMYKFAGDVQQPQMIIEEISSDRTEIKIKIRSKYPNQNELQQSLITLKEFYDDEKMYNSPVFGIGKEQFVLNCGQNNIFDISHILFEGTKSKNIPYPTSNFRGLPTIWIKTQITSGDGRRGSYFVEYYINGNQPTNRGAFWRLGAPPSISTVNETPPQLDEFENLNWYIERWTETDYTKGFSLPPHNFSQDYIGAPLYFWHGIPNFSNSGPSIDAQLSTINNTVDTLINNQKNKRQEKWEQRYIAGLAVATGISVGAEYDPPGAGLGYVAASAAAGAAVGYGAFWAGTSIISTAALGLSAVATPIAVVAIPAALIAAGIMIGNKETFEGELERTLKAYEEIIVYHRNSLNTQFGGTEWERGSALGELSLNTINAANFLIDECKRNIEQLDREYDALPNRKKNNAEGRIIERYLRVHSVIALQVRAWIRAQKFLQELGLSSYVAPDNSEFGVYAIADEFLDLNLDLKPIPNFNNRLKIWMKGPQYRVVNTLSNAQYGYTNLIIKLHKPILDEINLGTSVAIYGRLQKSFIEKIIAWKSIPILLEPFWSEPNFNINLSEIQNWSDTKYKSWGDLVSNNAAVSDMVVDKFFSIILRNLKIDYSNFSNFIKYSSAVHRVDNFKKKYVAAGGNITFAIRKKFDPFEEWVYSFNENSGSLNYSHYKLDNSIKSLSAFNYDIDDWYEGAHSSASLYDSQNTSKLSSLIPFGIAADQKNDDYVKFVDIVGHFFDIIWNAVREITSTTERQEHPDDGMPDNLLNTIATSYGWKLSDGYGDSLLYEYSLGVDSNNTPLTSSVTGSLYDADPSVSGSVIVKPKSAVRYEIWRRIINNLPYIYKTKGTKESIKAILSCYGIPQQFLTVKEYGGPIITASLSVHDNQFFVGGMLQNNTNNKVRFESSSYIVGATMLSPDHSSLNRQFDDAPLDSNLLGVYFSTTDTLNTHMYSWSFQSTGNYSIIDDWIGDPIDRKKTYYPSLRITSSKYFDYLNSSEGITYQDISPVNLLFNLVSNFDDSVFSQIEQIVPARANYYSGILIEPHILERNKIHFTADATKTDLTLKSNIPIINKTKTNSSVQYNSMNVKYTSLNTLGNFAYLAGNTKTYQSKQTPYFSGILTSTGTIYNTSTPFTIPNVVYKARKYKHAFMTIDRGILGPTSSINNNPENNNNPAASYQFSEIPPNLNNLAIRGGRWNKSFDGTPVVESYAADPFTLNAASTTGVFGGISTQVASNPKGISAVRNVLLEQPRIPISPSAGGVAPSSNQSAGTINTIPPTGPTPPES